MEYENKYASKGVAGTGLGLGIAGTVLGGLALLKNGGLGLFGNSWGGVVKGKAYGIQYCGFSCTCSTCNQKQFSVRQRLFVKINLSTLY